MRECKGAMREGRDGIGWQWGQGRGRQRRGYQEGGSVDLDFY